MGRKNQAEQEEHEATVTPIPVPGAPDGFAPVTPQRDENSGWLKAEAGLIVRGELMGRFRRQGGEGGHYFQIRLAEPVLASVRMENGEYSPQTLPVGGLLNLDEKKALEDLAELTVDGSRWEIWLRIEPKQQVKGTARTFWPMTVAKRQISPAPTRPPQDDGLPF